MSGRFQARSFDKGCRGASLCRRKLLCTDQSLPFSANLAIQDLVQEGFACQGSRQFHEYAEKVFVRFSNIRASCMVVSNLTMRHQDWTVKSISSREFSMVSKTASIDD